MSKDKYDMSGIFNPPQTKTRAAVGTKVLSGHSRPHIRAASPDIDVVDIGAGDLFDMRGPETKSAVRTQAPYVRSRGLDW